MTYRQKQSRRGHKRRDKALYWRKATASRRHHWKRLVGAVGLHFARLIYRQPA